MLSLERREDLTQVKPSPAVQRESRLVRKSLSETESLNCCSNIRIFHYRKIKPEFLPSDNILEILNTRELIGPIMRNFPNFPETFLHFPSQGGPPSLRRHFTQTSKLRQTKTGGQTKQPAGNPESSQQTSLVHSHWSRNVEARLSLVESFIVLLRQLSYAIKNQLGHPKPTRGFGTQRSNGSLLAPRWFSMA